MTPSNCYTESSTVEELKAHNSEPIHSRWSVLLTFWTKPCHGFLLNWADRHSMPEDRGIFSKVASRNLYQIVIAEQWHSSESVLFIVKDEIEIYCDSEGDQYNRMIESLLVLEVKSWARNLSVSRPTQRALLPNPWSPLSQDVADLGEPVLATHEPNWCKPGGVAIDANLTIWRPRCAYSLTLNILNDKFMLVHAPPLQFGKGKAINPVRRIEPNYELSTPIDWFPMGRSWTISILLTAFSPTKRGKDDSHVFAHECLTI